MSGLMVSSARRAAALLASCLLFLGFASHALAAPTIGVDDVTVTEGDGGAKIAVFTVSLSAPSATDVGFWVGTAELSAIGNDDFQHYYSSPYTIPAGQTSYTLNLVIFGDTVVETDESFEVRLENVSGATVAKGVGIGTILNDDAGAGPTLSIGDQWVTEGNAGSKSASFVVQLSQPAATDVSFSVASANGTASAGTDYTAINLSNQVIPAGQLRKTVTVAIAGDTATERDETFLLNLSSVTGATVGRAQARATIGNDDAVSAVKIYVSDAYVEERNSGPQVLSFFVSLSKPAATTVSFDIRTEDSTATAGSDYVALALVGQTIAAGQTSKQIDVTVNGDTLSEAEERLVITLSNISTNASVEYNDPHGVATIPNDDALISIADASVVEGDVDGKSMAFTVSLSTPLSSTVSFRYATCAGTATANEDYYSAGSPYYWQIPAGATSVNVNVEVRGDYLQEPDETFCVDLLDVSGTAVGDGHAVGTIVDDDVAAPTLSIGDVSMLEGDTGSQGMMFPVTLSAPYKNYVYFNAHTEACGAAQPQVDVPYSPNDYYDSSYTNITIAPGSTSSYVYVSIHGDADMEPDEQLCVRIDSVTNASLGTDLGVGTIVNDDLPPALSVLDVFKVEGPDGFGMLMNFAVVLSKPAPNDVTFDLRTDHGTAAPEVDFQSKSVTGLKLPAGQTYMEFQVVVYGDALVEDDETFTVNLGNAVGAAVAKAQGRGTIINDDRAGIRIEDASFSEGDDGQTTARFAITLSHPLPTPVTFDVATSANTASAGSDFVSQSRTGMMIDPGRSRAVFEVQVIGDTVDEPDEQFLVALNNVQGAEIVKDLAWATLLDDDASATTSIAAIQGRGARSPLLGQAVTTEGTVTALTGTGFYLQSEDARQDGDPASSEGVLVASATALAVGDRVRVQGRVQETPLASDPGASTQTQVAASTVEVLAHGQPLPVPVALEGDATLAGTPRRRGLERYEGMRVAIARLAVRGPSGGLVDERSGRVRGDGRFFGAVRVDGAVQGLRIASTAQRGAIALAADRGDLVHGLVGVLAEGAGDYDLLPDPSATVRIAAAANPTSVDVAKQGEATIGSLNLRRLLDDVRQGSEPVLAADAYALRLAKAANVLCSQMRAPFIVGVQDVENARALEDLAAALNSQAGNVLFPGACNAQPGYVAVHGDDGAGSRIGLLVSTAPVRPGLPRVEALSLSPLAARETFALRSGGREALFESPPLRLHARIHGDDGRMLDLAVVLVQRADFDARQSVASHGWPTRAAYLLARRAAQDRALASAIRLQRKAHPELPLVVLGDLDALPADLQLVDLAARMPGDQAYSIIRDGRPVVADKVWISRELVAPGPAARIEFARVNAGFGEDNYDDASVPVRVSDHDPLVLFLRMP